MKLLMFIFHEVDNTKSFQTKVIVHLDMSLEKIFQLRHRTTCCQNLTVLVLSALSYACKIYIYRRRTRLQDFRLLTPVKLLNAYALFLDTKFCGCTHFKDFTNFSVVLQFYLVHTSNNLAN